MSFIDLFIWAILCYSFLFLLSFYFNFYFWFKEFIWGSILVSLFSPVLLAVRSTDNEGQPWNITPGQMSFPIFLTFRTNMHSVNKVRDKYLTCLSYNGWLMLDHLNKFPTFNLFLYLFMFLPDFVFLLSFNNPSGYYFSVNDML